jgi:hypothetical protein
MFLQVSLCDSYNIYVNSSNTFFVCNHQGPIDNDRDVERSRQGNLASLLRCNAIKLAAADDSIKGVVAMTRCSAFSASSLQPEEYGNYVHGNEDPTVFFHVSGGATVIKVVEGYRPDDSDNVGAAILISYDLAPEISTKDASDIESKPAADIDLIVKEVCSFINTLHDPPTSTSIEGLWNVPLMNILDSIGMQLLRNRIQDLAQRELSVSFLFQYPTLQTISEYFTAGDNKVCRDQTLGNLFFRSSKSK